MNEERLDLELCTSRIGLVTVVVKVLSSRDVIVVTVELCTSVATVARTTLVDVVIVTALFCVTVLLKSATLRSLSLAVLSYTTAGVIVARRKDEQSLLTTDATTGCRKLARWSLYCR